MSFKVKIWRRSFDVPPPPMEPGHPFYDNIVKDYVTDVYTDVIEGYTIATIKLFGWFFFGGFLIMKGALLNGLVEDIGGN